MAYNNVCQSTDMIRLREICTTSIITHADGSCEVRHTPRLTSVLSVFQTISQKPMQPGSPNLTICSMRSPENTLILGQKVTDQDNNVRVGSSDRMQYCRCCLHKPRRVFPVVGFALFRLLASSSVVTVFR